MFLLYILKSFIEIHEIHDFKSHDQEIHQDELDEPLRLNPKDSLPLA